MPKLVPCDMNFSGLPLWSNITIRTIT